jgi:arylsulfatase A-like enzyme
MGNMQGGRPRPDYPGYTGQVPASSTFLPKVLRDAGYSTLMAGKWHLGNPGPVDRGFEEFYGLFRGFDSFWDSARSMRRAGMSSANSAKLDQIGQPGTYHSYGSGRANACNTPWRLYKHYTHEGGISTPSIAHWPAGLKGRIPFRVSRSRIIASVQRQP